MKLITIQNQDVLKQLENDGIYYPDPNKNMFCYTEIFKEYYKKKNKPIKAAVWAFYSIEDVKCNKLDDKIIRCIISNLPFLEDGIPMLLEVPEDYVFLSDFYAWAEYIEEISEGLDFVEPINWNIKVDWDKLSTVQAIIPCIKETWVKEIKGSKNLLEWG